MRKHKHRIAQSDIRDSAESILIPLSHANTLMHVINEWRFYGTISDFETDMANCAILESPQRFLCQITNPVTQQETWVSSEIIYRLPIKTIHRESEIHPANLKQYVEKLLNDQRAHQCLFRLMTLAGTNERDVVLEGIGQLRIENVIRPMAMLTILDLLEQYKIVWSVEWFTICTRIDDERFGCRHEWIRLKDWQVWRLWPLLSDAARVQCIERLGFRPPPVLLQKKLSPQWAGISS